jgi:Zn-dependent M16 (insulinase) family peptidase
VSKAEKLCSLNARLFLPLNTATIIISPSIELDEELEKNEREQVEKLKTLLFTFIKNRELNEKFNPLKINLSTVYSNKRMNSE